MLGQRSISVSTGTDFSLHAYKELKQGVTVSMHGDLGHFFHTRYT